MEKKDSTLTLIEDTKSGTFFQRLVKQENISVNSEPDGKNVTPESDIFEDKTDKIAFEKVSTIRQAFNFEMVNIPDGATLTFIRDDNITCEVISKNRVKFRGEEHSLSSSALILTNEIMGYSRTSICGPENWKYNGEVLNDIRVRLEQE